jgi:hypothetical protein
LKLRRIHAELLGRISVNHIAAGARHGADDRFVAAPIGGGFRLFIVIRPPILRRHPLFAASDVAGQASAMQAPGVIGASPAMSNQTQNSRRSAIAAIAALGLLSAAIFTLGLPTTAVAQVSESGPGPACGNSPCVNVDPNENAQQYQQQNQNVSPFTGPYPAICSSDPGTDPQILSANMQAAYNAWATAMQNAGGNQSSPDVVAAANLYQCYAGALAYLRSNPPPPASER